MSDLTLLLARIEKGDPTAANELLPLVYDELRQLAADRLMRERPGQTLQATALVHEAYIRLVESDKSFQWNSRAHFFGAAAEAMRRILIDKARQKASMRHGGQFEKHSLEAIAVEACGDAVPVVDLIALDEALAALEEFDGRKAQLVKLRFFAGLSISDAAQVLGISMATAKRQWIYARSWLYGHMNGQSREIV